MKPAIEKKKQKTKTVSYTYEHIFPTARTTLANLECQLVALITWILPIVISFTKNRTELVQMNGLAYNVVHLY